MGGLRPDPVAARRLADIARAGGGRGAGGYLPATAPQQPSTVHTPGRIVRPDQAPTSGGGGVYVPAFTIAGPIESRDYRTPLYNVTGSAQTITGIAVGLGTTAFAGNTRVRLYNLTAGTYVAEVYLGDDVYFVQSATVSHTWAVGAGLEVHCTVTSATDPGEDMVLQVITG